MNFITLKSSIEQILVDQSLGRYTVIGYQPLNNPASVIKSLRQVEVYYNGGDFPKNAGATSAAQMHDATFAVELTVAAATKFDVAKMIAADEAPTPEAAEQMRVEALQELTEAGKLADAGLDELISVIWNILNDSKNYNLGMQKGIVSSRWISSISKDDTIPNGEYVMLSGRMNITIRVRENVLGEQGIPGEMIDLGLRIKDDSTIRSGVIQDFNGEGE